MSDHTIKTSRGEKFVDYICRIISSDKGKAAILKRADNPSMEYQSWEILNRFGIDLTNHYERSIFGLIAAAMAKGKITNNGFLGIGEAIAKCYDVRDKSDQANSKLRRLIACSSTDELCSILRPLLQLILAKNVNNLDFARLLNELMKFQWDSLKIKAHWAQNFYRIDTEEEGNDS